MEDVMTYEFITKNGMPMIQISAINNTGIAEGYCSTRNGGTSEGEWGSLNCSIYKPLDIENSRNDFRLFCSAINVDPNMVITNRLIAGTNIVRIVTEADLIDIYNEPIAPRADGLITNSNKITLYMYSADCAIIQLVDTKTKSIGMLHAGWKGTLNGIISNTVNAMHDAFGADPSNLIAVICPSIGKCCFEVGNDVAVQFKNAGLGDFISDKYEKPHIDLFGANKEMLIRVGLKEQNISVIDLCTFCHSDLLHSYRRGPIKDGKHLNGMNGMFLRLI